ncbi:hypothetical protein PENTCL1PPCAC_3947 [Pristionchus entomophagus]|uniref:Uncharacterized protein n=1 Tax=Pristionchus entomophagus TaxID=358040 RepID=A0AAV5SGG9_9BILA|nr:hypothetical protein PENTCL1PPCAC_3947 [Pristionchus entomophagus]
MCIIQWSVFRPGIVLSIHNVFTLPILPFRLRSIAQYLPSQRALGWHTWHSDFEFLVPPLGFDLLNDISIIRGEAERVDSSVNSFFHHLPFSLDHSMVRPSPRRDSLRSLWVKQAITEKSIYASV